MRIDLAQDGDIAVLTMSNGRVNALDLDFCTALSDRCSQIRNDLDRTRAVVLTASGSVFSAGVDLQAVVAGGMAYVDELLPALDRVFSDLLFLECPVVPALNGPAVGGGAVLASCGDQAVASSPSLRIGLPELAVGVPLPLAGLEAVQLALGPRAGSAVFSSHVKALSESPWADVVQIAPSPSELIATALGIATELTRSGSTAAFGAVKAQLRRPAHQRIEAAAASDRSRARQIWKERLESGAIERFLTRLTR